MLQMVFTCVAACMHEQDQLQNSHCTTNVEKEWVLTVIQL